MSISTEASIEPSASKKWGVTMINVTHPTPEAEPTKDNAKVDAEISRPHLYNMPLASSSHPENKVGSQVKAVSRINAFHACKALPTRSAKYFVFSDGCTFRFDLVASLTAHIKARAPQLPRGIELTLREICGDESWLRLVGLEYREAGRCARLLCKDGYVPLIDQEKTNSANAHLFIVM